MYTKNTITIHRILSNTFLTKNMQVLVYGEWEGSSKNVKSFFTATYSELEVQNSNSKFKIQNLQNHFDLFLLERYLKESNLYTQLNW